MSVLSSISSNTVDNAILNIARPIFAVAIWTWYAEHQDDVVLRKWSLITIRVRDLRWLVEALAGPEDEAAVTRAIVSPSPEPR